MALHNFAMKNLFRRLYISIPFRKEIFLAIKKIWMPPADVYQHLHFTGTFKVNVDNEKYFYIVHHGYQVENELFWGGVYNGFEKYSLSIWSELSKTQGVIFDIGANTGIYSLVAKANNGKSSVHAFEPFPEIHKLLVQNVSINSFDVHCNCMAISNSTGDGVIYADSDKFAYSASVNKNQSCRDSVVIDIKTITLIDYIEKNNITEIDLMKIDVETHEPEVMEGFGKYFKKFKPILLIEVLSNEVADKLRRYFSPVDFDFYNIDELVGVRKVSSLSKSDYYNYYIVPKEKSHLMDRALLNREIKS